MRRRERVVDEEVAELGERGDEGRIVLLLAGVKAGVLQTEECRRASSSATARSAASPMQSSANATGRLSVCATSAATGLSESFGVAALRPAEMREQDHLGALVGKLGDRRRDALDAGGVGDLAVLRSAR